ncbi:MAG: multiheme c-type cytochrome [Thermodesulfobacteriota bacterium]
MRRCARLLSFVAAILLLAACSPFGHLTSVNHDGPAAHGPRAAECGQCHIEQHREWQTSSHAHAFGNPRFQAALAGSGEECLGCHAPATVRTGGVSPQPRRYHREDGVSCLACHLDKGTMTGPGEESALFTPHPVRQESAFFRDSALCGSCHQETFAAWQASSRATPATPTCQECHMPAVSRTATQGTNPFSRALVSFEAVQASRRHTFGFAHLAGAPGLVEMSPLPGWRPTKNTALSLAVRNQLPHPLPAVGYRSRSVRVTVRLRGQDGTLLGQGSTVLGQGDGASFLSPGENRILSIPMAVAPAAATQPVTLAAALVLLPLGDEGDLTLAQTEFPLPPPP